MHAFKFSHGMSLGNMPGKEDFICLAAPPLVGHNVAADVLVWRIRGIGKAPCMRLARQTPLTICQIGTVYIFLSVSHV